MVINLKPRIHWAMVMNLKPRIHRVGCQNLRSDKVRRYGGRCGFSDEF